MQPALTEAQRPARPALRWDLRAYAMVAVLLAIWAFFAFKTDGAFLTPRNLSNLAVQMSVTAILATGMVLVIVAGHVDLSVGSILGLTGGLAAILEAWANWPTPLALAAALAAGALLGALNGWLVAYHGVPAFIVTLGAMMIWRGVLLGVTRGVTVSGLTPAFKFWGQGFVPKPLDLALTVVAIVLMVWGLVRRRAARLRYGLPAPSPLATAATALAYAALMAGFTLTMNAYEGIPVPIFLVVALVALFTFLAQRTRFGRHIYAIGGNVEAARFAGIPIRVRVLTVFILSGLLAAVAGLVLTGRLAAATITAGQSYELDAVAACVIGGTSLMGGTGTVAGAIVGALVMASLDNGMSMLNTDAFWQYIVKGLILVLAVWMDIATRNRGASRGA